MAHENYMQPSLGIFKIELSKFSPHPDRQRSFL